MASRVDWDQWKTSLLASLPGVTETYAALVFWNAAREFYRRTRSWKETLGAFDLAAGVDRIPLDPVDQNCRAIYLEAVTRHKSATPGLVTLAEGPHMLFLVPAAAVDIPGALSVRVSVIPRLGAELLPDYAATHHFDALMSGALGRLFSEPKRPWSEPASGRYHLQKFETEIARARADSAKDWLQDAPASVHVHQSLR